ncbi:MAG: hypothetical protein M3021_06225, partial [Actinomycetota bacterium]|nr:hypothetical protein [Actinomycetota bacterium]
MTVAVLNMLYVVFGLPGMVATDAGENEPFERSFPENHDFFPFSWSGRLGCEGTVAGEEPECVG